MATTTIRPANRTRRTFRWPHLTAYLMVLPAIAFVAVFSYYPFVSTIQHAFTAWNGLSARPIGWSNFRELAGDRIFLSSFRNALIILVANLVKTVTVPLLVAELVFWLRNQRLAYLFRILFVVPLVIPEVAFILVWKHIYAHNGFLNNALRAVGAEGWVTNWLGHPDTAMAAIVFMGFPYVLVVPFLIYLASLKKITPAIFDSAQIDGANGLTRFLHIDLPLLRPALITMSMLAMISAFNGYYSILVLTDGGPGYSTMVPALHMYKTAFQFGRMGYGSAVATVLLVITATLTFGAMLLRRRVRT